MTARATRSGGGKRPAAPKARTADPGLVRARDRLLEAALWLATGEPRERVAEALLAGLDELETVLGEPATRR